ncbi:DAK2 domain-containing protein [Arthrobacter sp. UM1]|uniref:DAK2 domain-containing protein n=1 Tax=Arthrobacter sp. UM1 TaxID=2766776 RepID=UPI001CF66989|nr:DAK2 domain-containing protein [Arthrobacter sp. UM1]MCB4207305.1 DAK2 domain-containing protein [Arthrobacter sp. UM1]
MAEKTARQRKLPEAAAVAAWIGESVRRLEQFESLVNGINVFPVKDRDTGTNLLTTVRAGLGGVAEGGAGATTWGEALSAVAEAASRKALGNSGTVFVIVLSTLADRLSEVRRLDAAAWASALSAADVRASSAISDRAPASVFDVIAAAAACPARPDSGLGGLQELVAEQTAAAAEAVRRTHGGSEALARYGVIDAGAVGLLVIMEAFRSVVVGEEFREETVTSLPGLSIAPEREGAGEPAAAPVHGVEVVCTVSASPLDAAVLRASLDALGDSVIMTPLGRTAADPSQRVRWRIHVHVEEKQTALEAIEAVAVPEDVSVSSLSEHGVRHRS